MSSGHVGSSRRRAHFAANERLLVVVDQFEEVFRFRQLPEAKTLRDTTTPLSLDEATAFAAGHRPCFFCRRDDANRFRAAWEEGNGVKDIRARAMDTVLHSERLERSKKRLHPLPMPVAQLPDGAMVQQGEESFLILQGRALQWSMGGYQKIEAALDDAMLLTPPSTLRALNAGYRPVLHPSAQS
jgi:hypothetical protein